MPRMILIKYLTTRAARVFREKIQKYRSFNHRIFIIAIKHATSQYVSVYQLFYWLSVCILFLLRYIKSLHWNLGVVMTPTCRWQHQMLSLCCQWRQSWYHDDSIQCRPSVTTKLTSRQSLYCFSVQARYAISCYFGPCFNKTRLYQMLS